MAETEVNFEQFEQALSDKGSDGALRFLGERFLKEKQYHQYFEVLKMEARRASGLPLLYEERLDALGGNHQKEFEDRLLEACETVGELFFKDGDAANGWVYFQPLADTDKAKDLLMQIEVNEENVDDLVQIALVEGVAPRYGFDLVLKHFGTCNSITTYDSQVSMLSKQVKRDAAELLVDHLHGEIRDSVKVHIQEQEGKPPAETTLWTLIENRDWLFSGGGHHADTTHLASVVRIARQARDPEVLKRAVELAEYGMRLDDQFQFDGDEPFEKIYPDHLRFFKGLLGEATGDVEAWFLKKIAAMEPGMVRSITVETLIDFLASANQNERAIEVALKEMNDEHQSMGIAPNLYSLANGEAAFEQIANHFQQQGDLLSYSIARLLDSQ